MHEKTAMLKSCPSPTLQPMARPISLPVAQLAMMRMHALQTCAFAYATSAFVQVTTQAAKGEVFFKALHAVNASVTPAVKDAARHAHAGLIACACACTPGRGRPPVPM